MRRGVSRRREASGHFGVYGWPGRGPPTHPEKVRNVPAYQGEFDGLCGMYAIANAYELCGGDDGEGAFRMACRALSASRWPAVLWSGTSLHDMMRMIKKCQAELEWMPSVSYPFLRRPPTSDDGYWRALRECFTDEHVKCAIVELKKPWEHWVVISPDTERRIWFADSDRHEPQYRKNLTSLHAGERRPKPNQWLIDRRALILFEERPD